MKQNTKIKAVLLFASSMTVMSGAIISPALAEIAKNFPDSSDVVIKLIITMPALLIAVFGTVIGTLSDKWGRKRLLIYSLIIYGIGGFSGYFINQIGWLLVSRGVLGLGVAGIMSIATTLISDYFDGEERKSFVGSQTAFMSLGGVVFLIAGGLLSDISWRFPFLLYLAAFVLLPFVISVLYEPDREKGSGTDNRSLSGSGHKKIIALVYMVVFLGMVFFYMIPTQIPFLLEARLSSSNTMNGVAIALTTLTGAIASVNYGRIKKRLSYRAIFALCFLLMATGYSAIAWFSSYAGIMAGLGIAGIGMGLLMPNGNLWLMEIVSINIRGKVIGGMSSVLFFGQFVSPLLAGLIIDQFDLTTAFYAASGSMLILSILLYFFSQKSAD